MGQCPDGWCHACAAKSQAGQAICGRNLEEAFALVEWLLYFFPVNLKRKCIRSRTDNFVAACVTYALQHLFRNMP